MQICRFCIHNSVMNIWTFELHSELFLEFTHIYMRESSPFKKVKQHGFIDYIFNPGFVLVMLDITRKPVYLPFDGMYRVSKLGAMLKMKSCKIDWIIRRCMVFHVLCFAFVTIKCVSYATFWIYRQLRARRALLQFKDIPLKTRRALLLYKVYGDSALLVFNGTSLICNNALLALNWRHMTFKDNDFIRHSWS